MEKSERFFSFDVSKTKIENWCAYRDRSVAETEQKLFTYGLTNKQVQKIISELKEMNFLDDRRFALSFVTGKFRIKKWGKQKIYMHIQQKRISKDFVRDAIASIDYDEYLETAKAIVEKKWALLAKEKDVWTRKQKVIQYLAGRGFEFDVIQEAFKEAQL